MFNSPEFIREYVQHSRDIEAKVLYFPMTVDFLHRCEFAHDAPRELVIKAKDCAEYCARKSLGYSPIGAIGGDRHLFVLKALYKFWGYEMRIDRLYAVAQAHKDVVLTYMEQHADELYDKFFKPKTNPVAEMDTSETALLACLAA